MPETVSHLFRDCPSVVDFWRTTNLDAILNSNARMNIKAWIKKGCKMKDVKIGKHLGFKDAFSFYLWNIWLTRNNNIFNNNLMLIPIRETYERDMEYQLLAGRHYVKEVRVHQKWYPQYMVKNLK